MRLLVHALARARARSDAARIERLERALRSLSPALVVALVESHVWSDDDALDETDALPFQRRIDMLTALVPVLGDAGFERVATQVKHPSFSFDPGRAHVGVWTSGAAGPDELLGRIARRRADAGAVDEALAITERMLHLERRVAVLLPLRARLEPARWRRVTARAAQDARSFSEPVARFHALAWVAPLFGREEALSLVREAIDALPPKARREWCHYPGGLMLMPLGGVVADALLCAGLDDDLAALAKELGPTFTGSIRDVAGDDDVEEALAQARDGRLYSLWVVRDALVGAARGEALDVARRAAGDETAAPEALLLYWTLARATREERAAAARIAACAASTPWERWPQLAVWSSDAWHGALDDEGRTAAARAALARSRECLGDGDLDEEGSATTRP